MIKSCQCLEHFHFRWMKTCTLPLVNCNTSYVRRSVPLGTVEHLRTDLSIVFCAILWALSINLIITKNKNVLYHMC